MLCIQSTWALPTLPLGDVLLSGVSVLILCVVAGIGTVMLLPGKQERPIRWIGGLVLLSVLLITGALLIRGAAEAATGTGVYFWIFSAIALIGAMRVVTHPRPVYSALYFVLTVFATAGLFVLMYAEFMAAALVLIYAGAILVTYVFVIMLAATSQSTTSRTRLSGVAEYDAHSREPFTAACIGFVLMGVLLFLILDKAQAPTPAPAMEPSGATMTAAEDEDIHGSTQSLGNYLFENQLVNLELAGLILTVAMVGAIVIARRRVVGVSDAFEPSAERITATMTPVTDNPQSIPVYGTNNPRQKAFPET